MYLYKCINIGFFLCIHCFLKSKLFFLKWDEWLFSVLVWLKAKMYRPMLNVHSLLYLSLDILSMMCFTEMSDDFFYFLFFF